MSDRLVWLVQCYIEDAWKEPGSKWPEWYVAQNTYSRWAAYELVELLKNRGNNSALKIAEDFHSNLDDYSCLNPLARRVFSIARDAIGELLSFISTVEK